MPYTVFLFYADSAMTLLFDHFRMSMRRPDHWVYGSWLDTVVKYRKTRLGILWLLIPTAVYIWGIGGFIASMQIGLDRARFFAHVGLGFAVFRLMATVITDSTTVFSAYQSYIYDGHLRLTDFLLRNLARSFFYFLASVPVLAVVVVASPDFSATGIAMSLIGIVVLLFNLFVYSILLAVAGARFPDLSEIMGSVMMAAFLVTPIVWYGDAAPKGTTSGLLTQANPFHHLLVVVRAPILGDRIDESTFVYLAVMSLFGIVCAALVYRGSASRIPVWL